MDRKITKSPLYTIVYLSFVFFVVVPIAYTLTDTFLDGSFVEHLRLLDKETFLLLAKSCTIAFSIALLSTLFGTALGFLLYKTNPAFGSFFKVALLIPLFISPYILAVAWKDFFYSFFDNTSYISSYIGVILVLTTVYTPLSMLIIGSALSNINAQLEETGMVITSAWRVIFRITLPLIKHALISSFVLVFILSISEFSVPAFFGVVVFTTELFTQFSAFYNHSLAICQSVLLILICISLLYAEGNYIGNAPFLSIGSKGTSHQTFNLKGQKTTGLIFIFSWFFLSVASPFIILFVQAFKDGTNKFVQAFALLAPTFRPSISLSMIAALLIVFMGLIVAYASIRRPETQKTKLFNWLLLIAFAIPSTIFGISLIKFYNQPALEFIYSSYMILLIAYIGKFLFIAVKLVENAMKQIPHSLDEAAQIAGISSFSRLVNIYIPLILPSLFAAFMISFIFSLSELGTTIMIYPPGTEIMPIKVFTIMANAPQSLTSSMTLIVFAMTLLIITSFYFIVKLHHKGYSYNHD